MARDFNGSNQYGQVARDYSAYSTLAVGGWVSFDTLAGGGSYNMIWEHTADGGANNGGFGLYYQGTNILAVAMCGNVGMNFGKSIH